MKDISYANASSVLVYGKGGIGKTTLIFNYPAIKRFVFDFEAGLKVVQNKEASVFRVTDYQSLLQGISYLEQAPQYDVVIVDSLTEMGRISMAAAMIMPVSGGGRPMPELPVLQDWGLAIERMRNLIRRIRLLIQRGKTVFFTAAESVDKDANSGRILGQPELLGKQLPSEVVYLMDEVYHMDSEQTPQGVKRVLYTQPDSIWTAKTRVPGAPAKVVVERDSAKTLDFLKGVK